MRSKPGAGSLTCVFATGAFLLLMPACAAEPGDAAAQVPGVQNGGIHGDSAIVVRRVFEGTGLDFYASEPSPDGRFLTEIDWDTGDLAVIDVLARSQRRLTDKGGWDTSSEYAETGVFSPDGSRIAYAWFDCENGDVSPCVYEVRVSNADGSDVRTLYAPKADPGNPRPYETFYPMLYGWAGDRILAMVYLGQESDPRARLGIFSAADGSFHSLVTFGQDVASRLLDSGQMALSADGGFAAYGIRAANGTDEDIVIVSAENGRETGQIAGPANDRVFGFAPDGGLLFASDRELTEGIWHQPLRNGRPDGDPVLLRSDLWRTIPIGMSRDALFYGVITESRGARVASFDPETGAVLSEPMPVEPPSSAATLSPVWSPDGRHLAYERIDTPNPPYAIVIRSLAGDDVREIPIQQRLNNLLAWTENGTLLAIDKAEDTGDFALFELDLETGTIETLYNHPDDGTTFPFFQVSANGPAGPRVYRARGTFQSWSLVGLEVQTGREFEVLPAGDWGPWPGFGASPDGETLALLLGKGGVLTVPAAGGTIREIQSGLTYSRQAGVIWAPIRPPIRCGARTR
jgi:peptidoglycan hydrolase-like protein with peptidoglycan-binding domain